MKNRLGAVLGTLGTLIAIGFAIYFTKNPDCFWGLVATILVATALFGKDEQGWGVLALGFMIFLIGILICVAVNCWGAVALWGLLACVIMCEVVNL